MTGQRRGHRPALDLREVAHLQEGGCSLEEIAGRLGVTVGAIEKARGRQRRRQNPVPPPPPTEGPTA